MAEVHVVSYFSVPTDLAAAMRSWPEFKTGQEYDVTLQDAATAEHVSVVLVQPEDEGAYVRVAASFAGALFDRVVGKVIYELAAHSDNLMVYRWG